MFHLGYRCIMCMVAQRGHVRSYFVSSISCVNPGNTSTQLKAPVTRNHGLSRSVSSQNTCNVSLKEPPTASLKKTVEAESCSKTTCGKSSSSTVPRIQENLMEVSPQTSAETKPKSLLGITPADSRDKSVGNSNSDKTSNEKGGQSSKSGVSSFVEQSANKAPTLNSLSTTQHQKASAVTKKKSKRKTSASYEKVSKQQKSSLTNPRQAELMSTKPQPSSKTETVNQGTKSGYQKKNRNSSTNLERVKTERKSKTGKQENVTGNQTSKCSSSASHGNMAASSSKPQPHLENGTKSKPESQDIKTSPSHNATTNAVTAGWLSSQSSHETGGQKSSQVMQERVNTENVEPTRTVYSGDSSAINNESSAILNEYENFSTASKNNYFSEIQFKCIKLPKAKITNELDRRRKNFLKEFNNTVPFDFGVNEGLESLDELMDAPIKIKSKSVKKEKRHNWATVKSPQVYLQPFMDVSIFCDMVQDAQALFDSARHHGQALQTEHYNTMLQAWARKGDLKQVRSLFSQMVKSKLKPDLQSYAAALECMGRMKDCDHSVITNCLEQMESEKLAVADIFNACTFTNDNREVILTLLQDVLPGFKAPPPAQRPQCELGIVRELYQNGYSTIKMDVSSDLGILSREQNLRKLDEQMSMEKMETVKIASIEQESPLSYNTLNKRAILEEHRLLWRKALLTTLKYERQKMNWRNKTKRMTVGKLNFYPFLSIVEPEEYVELMLEALQSLAASTEGCMTVSLARELGDRVQRKFLIRRKIKTGVADKMQKIYKKFVTQSQGVGSFNHREFWQRLEDENRDGPTLNADVLSWPATITLGLGSLLADIMIREVKINVNMANAKREKKMIPALYYMYTYRSFKQVGYVKPHPSLVELLQQAKEPQMPFESNLLPMLSPPIPWASSTFGAYPLSTTKIMRCRDGTRQHQLLLEKSKSAELYPVLDSLNQLASIPWMVNKPVLDVIISVFREGGSEVLDVPQLPSVLQPIPKRTGEAAPEELAKIQQERAALRKRQAEMHSLRMDMLYKLSIADKYREEVFWFPHNMDFRGRVYPCPPHLNQMGSDVTRSILLFAKGLPLGKDGLDWLKIHLVNLTGHKKRCSLAERLAYANEMLPEIVDSAENPLNGFGWWTTADDKWQALACCIEINNVLNHRGHASTYISHLPVHQDGSCNGLQHYAALGRDVIGAQQVNLLDTDIPQDVYSGVAQMVEEICEKDAESGSPLAKMLKGKIHRKVVKQTVMTVVYGVTLYGGKMQILKQLKELRDIPCDQRQYAARYLALKVFQSLRKMFTKTREIQDWLTLCAWLIAKAGQTVEWVTPLGLPVVQPYHKKNLRVINHADHIMYHEDRSDTTERPDSIKQKNAFPPNFIHSLDSTHMMLTSLHCHKAGIDFASVHDCFWTHACCVSTMNTICREQFVKLHSEEILESLADFMMQKYGHLDISHTAKVRKNNPELKTIGDYIIQVPQKGDFDLGNVLKSTFFFS